MFLAISFLAVPAGLGFAGVAALLSDSGIDGTIGAFLVLQGMAVVALAFGTVVTAEVHARARGLFRVIASMLAIRAALAAWFLIQNAVLFGMIGSLLAALETVAAAKRRIIA